MEQGEPEGVSEDEGPLAETLWFNMDDRYSYIVGYAEDETVRPNTKYYLCRGRNDFLLPADRRRTRPVLDDHQ